METDAERSPLLPKALYVFLAMYQQVRRRCLFGGNILFEAGNRFLLVPSPRVAYSLGNNKHLLNCSSQIHNRILSDCTIRIISESCDKLDASGCSGRLKSLCCLLDCKFTFVLNFLLPVLIICIVPRCFMH